MKFRKKPVVIEATQFKDGALDHELAVKGVLLNEDGTLSIPTLEGTMKANSGDWIITGVNGEIYPCKPDIFEKTYEPA